MMYTLFMNVVFSVPLIKISRNTSIYVYCICVSVWSECGGGIVQALHRYYVFT